jgi:hypothetical protein
MTYIYGNTLKTARKLLYTYTAADPISINKNVNYTYTGQNHVALDKVFGWRSDWTQIIANSFQDWNRIRNCPESTGQFFINSMAMHIEEVSKFWNKERKEMFLDTADISQPYMVHRTDVPHHIDLDKTLSRQLLTNGSFSIGGIARYNLPAYWTTKFQYTSGIVEQYKKDAVIGGGCLRMIAAPGKLCYIGQQIDIDIPATTSLTASIWYKTPIGFSYNSVSPSSSTFLVVRLTDIYSSVHTYKKELRSGTGYRWTKDWITVTTPSDISRIEYSIEIDNVDETSITREYLFDAAFLEISDYPTEFEASAFDVPEFIKLYGQFFNIPTYVETWTCRRLKSFEEISGYPATGFIETKISIYGIEDRELFFSEDLIPTRVSVESLTGSITNTTNSIYGILTNSLEETRERLWDISTTSSYRDMIYTYPWPDRIDIDKSYLIADPGINQAPIQTRSIASLPDLFSRYTISSRDLVSTGQGYRLKLEALTIKYDKIWSVAVEEYSGQTNRVLKIINPHTEFNKNYLESINDIVLFSGSSVTGGITSVGFSTTEPNTITLTTTGDTYSGYAVRLYRDYYHIDSDTRQVFLRELYTGRDQSIVII